MELNINKALICLFFIVCFSCKPHNNTKQFIFLNFEITAPATWNKIEMRGIDSYISALADDTDTLYVGYGDFGGPYIEDIRIYDSSEKDKRPNKREGAIVVFSDTPEYDLQSGKYNKQIIKKDTIAGFPAQITFPKEGTKGVVEVFIKDVEPGKNFSITGKNIDSNKANKILQILNSLKVIEQKN